MGSACSSPSISISSPPSPLLHFLLLSESSVAAESFNRTITNRKDKTTTDTQAYSPAALISLLSSPRWLHSSRILRPVHSPSDIPLISRPHPAAVDADAAAVSPTRPAVFDHVSGSYHSPVVSFYCDSKLVSAQFHCLAGPPEQPANAPPLLHALPFKIAGVFLFISLDFAPQAAQLIITEYKPMIRRVQRDVNQASEDDELPFVLVGMEPAEPPSADNEHRVSYEIGQQLAGDTGGVMYLNVNMKNGRHVDELLFGMVKAVERVAQEKADKLNRDKETRDK